MYESVTLNLTGDKYSLTTNYFPPINVHDDSKIALYSLKLNDVYDVNNIKYVNIDITNNQIQFPYISYMTGVLIPLRIGFYSFDELENAILRILAKVNKKIKDAEINFSMSLYEGRCHIQCSHTIDFNIENSLSSVLGFERKEYGPKIVHISERAVNASSKIKSIKVLCNIVKDSFVNELPSHTIYEFFPPLIKEKKSKGYENIIENPPYLAYHSLNTSVINSINIQLVDQDFEPIHTYYPTKISIVLHIKRRGV